MYGDSGNDSFYARDNVQNNDQIDGGSGTSDTLVDRDTSDPFINIEVYT